MDSSIDIDGFVLMSRILDNLDNPTVGTRLGGVLNADYPTWNHSEDDYAIYAWEQTEAGLDAWQDVADALHPPLRPRWGKPSAAEAQREASGAAIGRVMASLRRSCAYACGGTVALSIISPLVLCIGDSSLRVPSSGIVTSDVDALCTQCVPAPYGDLRTQTTVVDTSVRCALEARAPMAALSNAMPAKLPQRSSKAQGVVEPASSKDSLLPSAPPQSVRVAALEALPDQLIVIQAAIETVLAKGPVVLEPFKLNVYQTGGFFKAHVDTPRGGDMLGTLIVALPTAGGFVGGELVLQAVGAPPCVYTLGGDGSRDGFYAAATSTVAEAAHTTAEAAPSDKDDDGTSASSESTWPELPNDRNSDRPNKRGIGVVPWVAFFGDVPHEVRPVVSGTRITFTFNIRRAQNVEAPQLRPVLAAATDLGMVLERVDTARAGTPASAAVRAADAAELARLVQLHLGTTSRPLGLVLTHKYGFAAELSPALLKGADAALYAALEGRVDLRFIPIALHGGYTTNYEMASNATRLSVYSLTPMALAKARAALLVPPSKRTHKGAAAAEETKKEEKEECIDFVQFDDGLSSSRAHRMRGMLVRTDSTAAVEHTGNESQAGSDDSLYFSVALVATVKKEAE